MKKALVIFLVIVLSLFNYKFGKIVQSFLLEQFPNFSYQWSLVLPWFIICATPCLMTFKESGLLLEINSFKRNWKELLLLTGVVLLGLFAFVVLDITKYFHDVKYPLIFFIATPIAEELLFRGWIYGQLEKFKLWPVVVSAGFFGLHHFQYFNYSLTAFAIFQIGYTFLLGILFGLMRKKSKSIYLSTLTHIVINFVTVYF